MAIQTGTKMRILLALFLALMVGVVRAEFCQSVMLPESNETGGAVSIPPGGGVVINYTPPPNARVGLEFWHHAFPAGAPEHSQYLLVYLNRPEKTARRLFHASNAGPESGTGWPSNFPMSTWIHSYETLIVGWLNNTNETQTGYLIVTLRECYP